MPNVYTNTEQTMFKNTLNTEVYFIFEEIKDIIQNIQHDKNNLYKLIIEYYNQLVDKNLELRYSIIVNHKEQQEIIVQKYLITSKRMLLFNRIIIIVDIIIIFIYISLIIISIKKK